MKNDWEFDHVGLVVSDMDEVMAFYPSLGIGVDIGPLGYGADWPVPGSPEEERRPTTMTVYGKPFVNHPRPVTAGRVRVNKILENIQMGSLVIECIFGRRDGDGMNDDFFRDCGEGISHICFNVTDPEKETSALVKKGVDIVMSLEQDGKIAENYLGTSKYGNIWLSFRPPAGKLHKDWQAHNRAHPLVNDWKFRGMGVAVRDLDRAIEYYRYLNIATIQPEILIDSSASKTFRVHGLSGNAARARTRAAVMGPVVYEFAQPLEKETTFGEFLTKKGEGAYSLDFTVDDLEKETARLVYKGVRLVLSGKTKTGSAFAYFDTSKVGNMMVKLIQKGK